MQETFRTPGGTEVPAVTADEMREVDRVAVEETGPPLPSMMENAGRSLAATVVEHRESRASVVVLAGSGGNGGGGLVAARHLSNHGVPVEVVLDRPPGEFEGVTEQQLTTLRAAGISADARTSAVPGSGVVVDALVGYSLRGAPRGRVATLVGALDGRRGPVVSLDVPTGVDATTGERPGPAVEPDHTLTLALPKTGLRGLDGSLSVADVGIPGVVYDRAGVDYASPFGEGYRVPLD